MKIKSVQAAAITDPAVFGKSTKGRQTWSQGTDEANPLARYREHTHQGARFRPRWDDVACIATAEDGTWGLGITRFAGPVVPIINDYFGPLVRDHDCMATERLWDMQFRASAHFGYAGFASYALSAVDLALWDLKGKLLQRPVYELLGGPARESIFCYATGNDVEWYLELGFEAIKLACPDGPAGGAAALERNEALVADARAQVGPRIDLMVDCWSVSDLEFTVALAERWRPFRLKWIEDFLYPDDHQGCAEIRTRIPWQGLAAGERWYGPLPFQFAASSRSIDYFQPDVQWVGGVTPSMKIGHIAESAGLAVMMHCGANDSFGQHVCYAMPNNLWGEYFMDSAPGVPLIEGYRPTPGMSVPKDGYVVPGDAPGFGIELSRADLDTATSKKDR